MFEQALVDKKKFVDQMNTSLSVMRQCQLLGLSRSTFYHTPKPECDLNLELMRRMEDLFSQKIKLRGEQHK